MGIETAIGVGAGLGLLGGSKKSGNQTSTQTSAPWVGVQPYLGGLYQGARNTVADSYKNPLLSQDATNQFRSTINGDYLNPASNPFLGQYVNDALGLVKSNFAGQYGGQAGGNLGNSGYQEMLTRTLANTALPIYANAYNTERQNQLQASQMAPAMDAAPFAPLREYSAILQNAPGGSTTTSQPFFTNPAAGALGVALAGGQLFGMMGGRQGTNPFSFGGIPGYGG
jgi:hypothetical protein